MQPVECIIMPIKVNNYRKNSLICLKSGFLNQCLAHLVSDKTKLDIITAVTKYQLIVLLYNLSFLTFTKLRCLERVNLKVFMLFIIGFSRENL
jgi:hypothetical protein